MNRANDSTIDLMFGAVEYNIILRQGTCTAIWIRSRHQLNGALNCNSRRRFIRISELHAQQISAAGAVEENKIGGKKSTDGFNPPVEAPSELTLLGRVPSRTHRKFATCSREDQEFLLPMQRRGGAFSKSAPNKKHEN